MIFGQMVVVFCAQSPGRPHLCGGLIQSGLLLEAKLHAFVGDCGAGSNWRRNGQVFLSSARQTFRAGRRWWRSPVDWPMDALLAFPAAGRALRSGQIEVGHTFNAGTGLTLRRRLTGRGLG